MRNVILASLAVAGLAVLPAAAPAAVSKRKCDPNYRGACLKPNVSDYDCAGGSGNGPYYVRGPIRVVGRDHYRLDADHDGIACE
jgi:hypothetical protein